MSVVAIVVLSSVAALAVPVTWIAMGLLRFTFDRSAFRCRFGRRGRWSRCKTTARWRGDVLVVRVGPLWLRTLRVPVRLPLDARITPELSYFVRRLGDHPQSLIVRADDELRVAVRNEDRLRLAGPFLGLALQGPSAPRSGWRWHPRS